LSRKIDAGELVAAIGGVLVFVSLFLSWFGAASAWQAFELADLLLAGLALTVVLAALPTDGALSLGPRALLPLGALLVVVVGVQLVEPPPAVAETDRGTGAWMAIAGGLLVLAGGLLRVSRISVTVDVGGRDARRRVPAVDRRAARDGTAGGRTAGAAGAGTSPPAAERDPGPTQPFSAVDEEA
jgi:uncharacterized membrane protein